MMQPRARLFLAACLAAAALPSAQSRPSQRVEVSFAPSARSQPVTGMVADKTSLRYSSQ
jgi:hypothetical protein